MSDWYRWQAGDLILHLYVQPRASKDEIIGPHGDRLRVRITAPPVDGRANAHLLRLLAKAFGVTRGQIILLSGERARDKRLCIRSPVRIPPVLRKAISTP